MPQRTRLRFPISGITPTWDTISSLSVGARQCADRNGAGLLIGRKDVVAYALLNNSPHEDTRGRSQKVGQEEIIGMVKDARLYLREDHDALAREWQGRLERVAHELTKVLGVSTSFFVPQIANHVLHMQITWVAEQLSRILREHSA